VLDGKDKTFARFLLDLPSIPADVLDLLRDLCIDSTRLVQRIDGEDFELIRTTVPTECKLASLRCVDLSCSDHLCEWKL